MSSTVYYFSGTGNSLYIARELATLLDASLNAVKSVVGSDRIEAKADCVGIVFPVYNHRIPFIIDRFVQRLIIPENAYVFAVSTYGDSPCISLTYLSELLMKKGRRLSLGYGVKMPYNYICPENGISGLFKPFTLRQTPETELARMLEEAQNKIPSICEDIKARKEDHIDADYEKLEKVLDALHLRELLQKPIWLKISSFKGKTNLSYMESIQLMDAGFRTDDCVQCGTCVKICPVGNIQMTANGPSWLQHCEQCFACLQWCPKSALQFREGTPGKKRYHHPAITFGDML